MSASRLDLATPSIDILNHSMIRTIRSGMVVSLRHIELQRTHRSRSPTQLVKQLTHDRHQRRITTSRKHLIDRRETQLDSHPGRSRTQHRSIRTTPILLIPMSNQRQPLPTLGENLVSRRQIRPQLPIRNLQNLITGITCLPAHNITPRKAPLRDDKREARYGTTRTCDERQSD